MNPIFSILLKQLPNLFPLVDSLVKHRGSKNQVESRLDGFEEALELLAERSDYLDRRIKRAMVFTIISFLISLSALIIVLAR